MYDVPTAIVDPLKWPAFTISYILSTKQAMVLSLKKNILT